MPSERAPRFWKSFDIVPETIIQLAEEDVDCKSLSWIIYFVISTFFYSFLCIFGTLALLIKSISILLYPCIRLTSDCVGWVWVGGTKVKGALTVFTVIISLCTGRRKNLVHLLTEVENLIPHWLVKGCKVFVSLQRKQYYFSTNEWILPNITHHRNIHGIDPLLCSHRLQLIVCSLGGCRNANI